ncbi:thioredoxin family protein [Sulfitobacter sp. LCG007]
MRLAAIALTALLALPFAGHAAELGDDGLHKADWMQDTFKDLPEDLAEATADGKRLLVMVEQRGCIYCSKMHAEVYPVPEIDAMLRDDYFVVQINMFGDIEVTDFDGEVMTEKQLVRKWGLLFTPTLVFFPEEVAQPAPGSELAVAQIPGAFGASTTRDLLTWVLEKGYKSDEPFQTYHARMHNARVAEGEENQDSN